jgi:hypothetical protein
MAINYFHLNLPFKDPLNEEGMKWFFGLPPCFVSVPKEYFNIDAVEFFKKHKLIFLDAEVFSFPANYMMEIHVDAVEFTQKCKLNWAYSKGEHYNLWFKPKPTWTPRATDGYQDDGCYDDYSYTFNEDEVEEVERTTVRTPTCIVSGQPHSVRTYSEPRKAISVSLYPYGTDLSCLPKDWGIPISNMKGILNDYIVD